MNKIAVTQIQGANWQELGPRFAQYAHAELSNYSWRGMALSYKSGSIPSIDGMTPKDFMTISMQKLTNEKRSYREDWSLEMNLKLAIRSEIANYWDKQRRLPEYAQPKEAFSDQVCSDPILKLVDPRPTNQAEVIELNSEQDGLLSEFEKSIEDDEELHLVFLCHLDGVYKNSKIEENADIQASRVSELKRKLRQKAHKFIQNNPHYQELPLQRHQR